MLFKRRDEKNVAFFEYIHCLHIKSTFASHFDFPKMLHCKTIVHRNYLFSERIDVNTCKRFSTQV